MTAGGNWVKAFSLGAKAAVLLGSEDETQSHVHSHLTPLPINAPRFYVPPGPLAQALRNGQAKVGTLFSQARWTQVTATNIYVLVGAGGSNNGRKALCIGVPIDSMSVVPQLAPGADAAVDLAVVLNLLRSFANNRPTRPVLFAFVDAYGVNQLGVRQMLAALAITPRQMKRLLERDNELLKKYRRHDQLARELSVDRKSMDKIHHHKYVQLHRYIKDEVARDVNAIEAELRPLRLKLPKASNKSQGPMSKRIKYLADRRGKFYAAQVRLLTKAPIEDNTFDLARTLWERARSRVSKQFEELEQTLETYRRQDRLRIQILDALGLGDKSDCPLDFLLGLDLSDGGVAVGPCVYCRLLLRGQTASAHDFIRWLDVVGKRGRRSLWPSPLARAVNVAPLLGLDAPESHTVGNVAAFTSPARSFGIPAATWATLDGRRQRVDTPSDTAERLNWERLNPQIDATAALLNRLVSDRDPSFEPTTKVVAKWNRIQGTIVDQSPGEPVARLPMKNYLTALVNGRCTAGYGRVSHLPHVSGIRRLEFAFTGVDGRFHFDALPGHAGARRFFVQSYKLDPHGGITRAVDLAKTDKGVRLNVDIRSSNPSPLRAVVFTCTEVSGFEFFDPRFLLNLGAGTILDAARGSKPQRINFCLYRGQMSCFLEPGVRWQAILRAGPTKNRMALLNVGDPEAFRDVKLRHSMRGFDISQEMPLTPLHQAAMDLYRLDERRLSDYRRAGITSKAIERLRQRTGLLLGEAARAVERDDGALLLKSASGALANEIRAYQAVRDMANDVVRGAIFLLLALVPLSFAVERLIFATPHVYRQIAGVLAIFAVMAAILWSFHPAFRISSQPLMIIMAFGIIFMSLLVITMIFSKFESELEEVRSGRAESSGARTSRWGVMFSALWLGIANMRKRKLRTVLTGSTVCLITFALLCFTSATTYMGHREFGLGITVPIKGILLRQPATRAMPEEALTHLKNVVGEDRVVAPRFWWCDPWRPQWRVHVRNPRTGKQISLQAALGLTAAEATITKVDQALPQWSQFAAEGGCYLAKETAKTLGVEVGETVVLAGRSMRLIDVFDASQLDNQIRDIDGESLMPIDYSAFGDEQRRVLASMNIDLLTWELESGVGLDPDRELARLSSAEVVIVPAEMLKGIPNSSLRSVAVGTETYEQARRLTAELTKRLAFPIYFTSKKGVRVIAATPLLARAPKSLFIPLVIAGLIIFNTMLNSVAERKGEIHVYTSLGLAPMHVGALFLAEAATYGLMGSVFGYIVGQGAATAFSKLGWLGGITLNYSGTQAVATMVMVLAVVVLSSLVPAFIAGRLAAPSTKMTWKVPKPENDIIRDTLPFTVTGYTANGVVTYLFDYLSAHGEGSIGNFSSDDLRTVSVPADGVTLLGLECTVWLTPYDLGIRQAIRLMPRRTDEHDIYELDVELRRGSGPSSSWWKLNRVFLADLRKQLLGWRKLKTQRILEYIAEGREMAATSQSEQATAKES